MATGKPTTGQDDAISVFARAGYAARGVVYLLIGGLAALAAFGQGGQTEGSKGALERLLTAPGGGVMLGAIAVGLLGYATWRTIQAVKDTDHHGTDAKGIAIRSGLLVSAVTHILLAYFAANLIFHFAASSGGSGGGSQGMATWLIKLPYGPWIVAAVGLVFIGAGIAHGIKGWKAQFDRHFDMPASTQQWAYPICRFGLVVRGLVFVIVGSFFLIAAYQVSPEEAGGLTEVFSTLRRQMFGKWLLAFVAVGLFAFGLYSLLEAIYRRVNPSS